MMSTNCRVASCATICINESQHQSVHLVCPTRAHPVIIKYHTLTYNAKTWPKSLFKKCSYYRSPLNDPRPHGIWGRSDTQNVPKFTSPDAHLLPTPLNFLLESNTGVILIYARRHWKNRTITPSCGYFHECNENQHTACYYPPVLGRYHFSAVW